MLTLISTVQAIDGKEVELEKQLLEFSEKVKSEDGTLMYYLHRVKQAKGRFLFYEAFRDENAFESHNTSVHMNELAKKIGPLLASEPQLMYLEKIAL